MGVSQAVQKRTPILCDLSLSWRANTLLRQLIGQNLDRFAAEREQQFVTNHHEQHRVWNRKEVRVGWWVGECACACAVWHVVHSGACCGVCACVCCRRYVCTVMLSSRLRVCSFGRGMKGPERCYVRNTIAVNSGKTVHGSQACRSLAAPIPCAGAGALRAQTPRDPGILDRHRFRQWCACCQRRSCSCSSWLGASIMLSCHVSVKNSCLPSFSSGQLLLMPFCVAVDVDNGVVPLCP